MQGYCSGRHDDVPAIVSWLENCIVDIYAWCGAERLQLNADKTELLWFGPVSQLRQLPSQNSAIHVNQCVVKPVTVVRYLGVWFHAELSMLSRVSWVTQTCFYHLRRIRAVRRQFGRDITARLVTALVLSRLDYCNAVQDGLPASTLALFQRVLHAAARTVLDLKPRDRVTLPL